MFTQNRLLTLCLSRPDILLLGCPLGKHGSFWVVAKLGCPHSYAKICLTAKLRSPHNYAKICLTAKRKEKNYLIDKSRRLNYMHT